MTTGFDELTQLANTTDFVKIRPELDPAYVALTTEAAGLLKYAESRTINSDTDIVTATEDLGLIGKLMKAIEDLRKQYVQPLNDHVKAINATFRVLTELIDKANQITREKILAYKAEIERKRKEAEEINRLRMEAAQKEAALNGTGEISESINLVEAPPPAVVKVHTETGSLGTMKVRKYRILDFAKLPDQYKIENSILLNKVTKAGIPEIPGVEFYFEEILRVNSR